MTLECLNKGNELQDQIRHISKVIDFLTRHHTELDTDDPTDISAFDFRFCSKDGVPKWQGINEGEIDYIISALEVKLDSLEKEFDRLY